MTPATAPTAPAPATVHALRVAAVERLTEDSVVLTFEVPPELRAAYAFRAGQHVALRRFVGGREVRRTYSVCDPAPGPGGPERLRVAVRLVESGEFSGWAHRELAAGDVVEVMTPAGRFVLEPRPGLFAAVVGGSGVTPVLSMVATALAGCPKARFCLVRADRTTASTMFLDEVADLKDRWPGRLQVVTVLSREERGWGPASGRLSEERLRALLPGLLPVTGVDGWFLCGPYGLVVAAERALRGLGVPRGRIHEEVFHVAPAPAADGTGDARASGDGTTATGGSGATAPGDTATTATVRAVLGGRAGSWAARPGESVLDTVLRHRPDAPFACRGGVCGTCRARLVAGEVRMDRNFALEEDEVGAGYVLACQSHPVTESVEVDFDS
jgi:ring-1,2-phenylacetyl-CoA epoxidase subunit PaaE